MTSQSHIEDSLYRALWQHIPNKYRDDALEPDDISVTPTDESVWEFHVEGGFPFDNFREHGRYTATVDGRRVQFVFDDLDWGVGHVIGRVQLGD